MHAIELAAECEAVQVGVRSPHCRLEHVMQLREPDAARGEEPSPDRWHHLFELDPELEHRL